MTERKAINADLAGTELPPSVYKYTDRDIMLYALGVGATDLDFVYERNLKVIPSFAVIPAFPILWDMLGIIDADLSAVLHGEQSFTIHRPIPVQGRLTTTGKIASVYDKTKGAFLNVETETRTDGGDLLFTNRFGAFVRGKGGFGGERGPEPGNAPPERAPDRSVEMPTSPIQATIYRLSGDRNPLHVDPEFAKTAGFERPILHGLCTFGHACRAVLAEYCDNDPARFHGMSVRFSGIVFPGDTIITDMWDEGGGNILLRTRTTDGRIAISNAAARVR